MTQAKQDRTIYYIEFSASDVEASKAFFIAVFGWEFTDYGPDYTSFTDGQMSGGFERSESSTGGGPLVVLYADDLEATKAKVTANGGTIVKDTFEYPGGRRFHFTEPSGNELSVCSE